MQRSLEPEILDSLPPDHPDALHNRRDLRVTNRLLRSHRWILNTLPSLLRSGERALELGAGTGELGTQLAQRGVSVHGLDLWPRPADWPASANWHGDDLRSFEGYGGYAAVFGNLIFHQFTEAELQALGKKIRSSTRIVLACEPTRRRISQTLYRTLGPLFRANYVSLHDAQVSIAAGFRGNELADYLGLAAPEWEVRCSTTLLGLYRLVAVRK